MADKRRGRAVGFGVLIAVLEPAAGISGPDHPAGRIDLLWVYAPSKLPTVGLVGVALVVPTLAGVAVAWLRSGADGHNPMFGIALKPVTGQQYPWVIGAIAATLVGGLVLGPEVAMVSTGAFVGTGSPAEAAPWTSPGGDRRCPLRDPGPLRRPVAWRHLLGRPDYTFDWRDLVGSVGVAAVTTGAIAWAASSPSEFCDCTAVTALARSSSLQPVSWSGRSRSATRWVPKTRSRWS